MRDQFYLHFETMPKGTSQQKGIRITNGKAHFYSKGNIEQAEAEFMRELSPHRPKRPSTKPIKLVVWFAFDTKNKKLWGGEVPPEALLKFYPEPWADHTYKPTRPDTDNYIKLFKDCMTKAGFWLDDAQVVDERIVKTYAERATIAVSWEEVLK